MELACYSGQFRLGLTRRAARFAGTSRENEAEVTVRRRGGSGTSAFFLVRGGDVHPPKTNRL